MPVSASMASANVFIDNFNRANGNLGSNYLTSSAAGWVSLQVISNTAGLSTNAGYNFVDPQIITFPRNQEATLTLTTRGAFDYIGAGVRMGVGFTGYILSIDGFNTSYSGILRCDGNGTFVKVASGTWVVSAVGDVLTIRATGNVISVYKNKQFITSIVDNTHTSGQPGVMYIADNVRATRGDNFIAADIPTTNATSLCIISQNPVGKLIEGSQ